MKFFTKKVLGFLISAIFIVLILKKVDLEKSYQAFMIIDFKYLLLAVPVYYFTFFIRAYRWKIILTDQFSLKIRSLISSMFIGSMVNCLLPGRIGELYKAHLLGKKENISKVLVFASIVFEKVLDGTIIFLMLLILTFILYSKALIFKYIFIIGGLFIVALTALFILAIWGKDINSYMFKNFQKGFLIRISTLIESFINGLNIFQYPDLVLKSSFLTFCSWLLEAFVFFIIICSFGISITPLSALFVLCLTTLSTTIPAGPASIGPYQYGYMLGLTMLGVDSSTAFTVSIVNQLVTMALILLAGLFFMLKDHINLKELEN